MSTDTVTVLHSVDNPPRFLTKTNVLSGGGAWNGRQTRYPKWFGYRNADISGIANLSALLVELAPNPFCCIIRGNAAGQWTDRAVQRKKEVFAETPRRWVLLDVEKFPVPEDLNLFADAKEIARRFVELLPAEFHDVSHHVQLSGSAGKNPNEFRAHFW